MKASAHNKHTTQMEDSFEEAWPHNPQLQSLPQDGAATIQKKSGKEKLMTKPDHDELKFVMTSGRRLHPYITPAEFLYNPYRALTSPLCKTHIAPL